MKYFPILIPLCIGSLALLLFEAEAAPIGIKETKFQVVLLLPDFSQSDNTTILQRLLCQRTVSYYLQKDNESDTFELLFREVIIRPCTDSLFKDNLAKFLGKQENAEYESTSPSTISRNKNMVNTYTSPSTIFINKHEKLETRNRSSSPIPVHYLIAVVAVIILCIAIILAAHVFMNRKTLALISKTQLKKAFKIPFGPRARENEYI